MPQHSIWCLMLEQSSLAEVFQAPRLPFLFCGCLVGCTVSTSGHNSAIVCTVQQHWHGARQSLMHAASLWQHLSVLCWHANSPALLISPATPHIISTTSVHTKVQHILEAAPPSLFMVQEHHMSNTNTAAAVAPAATIAMVAAPAAAASPDSAGVEADVGALELPPAALRGVEPPVGAALLACAPACAPIVAVEQVGSAGGACIRNESMKHWRCRACRHICVCIV